MTKAVFKDQAKRLAEHLSRVHGVKLKSSSMLEAVASLHGRADWNTLLACGSVEAPSMLPAPMVTRQSTQQAARLGDFSSLYEEWLRQAIKSKATSLSIQPNSTGCTVFMRVDGRGRLLLNADLADYAAVRNSLYDATGLSADDKALTGKFEGGAHLAGYNFTLRSIKPAPPAEHEHLYLHWTPTRVEYSELEALGLSTLPQWRHGISQASGLCIIAGLTDSGRSTTIAASAKALVVQGRRVNVLSSEIAPSGVPGALFEDTVRQPGDVVVLGELRSHEDMSHAMNMAANGMLVLAEVHGRDSEGALQRMRAMGARETHLDSCLNVVVAQHLVARVCNVCRSAEGSANSQGCRSCYKGYSGRLLLSEGVAAYPGRKITSAYGAKGNLPNIRLDAVAAFRQKLTTREELMQVFGPDVEGWLKSRD